LEVAGAVGVVDAHLVADAQLGQRGRGAGFRGSACPCLT
jgi:hypothetical protein